LISWYKNVVCRLQGVDPDSGIPFEDLYCGDSPRGVAILGDSAAAHFHIPPNYFMAETLNKVSIFVVFLRTKSPSVFLCFNQSAKHFETEINGGVNEMQVID